MRKLQAVGVLELPRLTEFGLDLLLRHDHRGFELDVVLQLLLH